MKSLAKKLVKSLLGPVCSIGLVSVYAFAEDTVKTAPDRQAKIEALKKLKAENPEEFKRVVKERKEKLKAKLEELKAKDPEKYKEVTQRMRERRREHLEKLREENPEKFREIMQKKAERLKELKEKDPARYAEFMKNHPKVADRLQNHHNRGIHRGEALGVRDYGKGLGRGKGEGVDHRTTGDDYGQPGGRRD